jgi:hypothetical protein
MNGRRVAWLLIAAVAVIGFAIWVSSLRHLEHATLGGDLVLPGLESSINAVTEVRLRKGDGTLTTLQATAAAWTVKERGWPAQVNKVRKLLLDLGALNVVEEKTRLAANYPALGVEELSSAKAAGTEVEVVSPGHTWVLIVGKSSGAKAGYVRVAGAVQSLLAAPLLEVDADPRHWLETALIDIPAERVREIEERPAAGTGFTASRQKKEDAHFTVAPLPKGRELSAPGAADSLAAALSGLTLEDVAKAVPADPQAAHALFRTFDGLEVEAVGHKDATHAFVALSARSSAPGTADEARQLNARFSGWEFEIADYKYAAIFAPVTELLKPRPPLPEPGKKPAKVAPKTSPGS